MTKSKTPLKRKDTPATQSKAIEGVSHRRNKFLVEPLVLSHEVIAARAYQIWESSGSPAKREIDHWIAAERELLAGRFVQPDTTIGVKAVHTPYPDV